MTEWFEKTKIGDLPNLSARTYGDHEALVYGTQRWSYKQFNIAVNEVAKGLIGIGVKHGEHVALWMTNSPEWLFLMYATAKIGAVLVPLNTRYRTDDVAYTVRQSDSATWISMDQSGPINYLDMIERNLRGIHDMSIGNLRFDDFPKLKRVIVTNYKNGGGIQSWDGLLEAGSGISNAVLEERAKDVHPDNTVIIAYTSGTTGHPKGVMHSHIVIRNLIDRINRFGVTFNDTIINNLPMFHLYGYSESALLAMISGARQILMDSFDAEETLRLVEKEKATIMHGFDTHYKDMLEIQKRDKRDLSSLRISSFPSGMQNSTPIAYRTQNELTKTVSGWGMSETWAFASCSHPNSTEEQRCEASGYPQPNLEFRVVDPETMLDAPIGKQGELLVRGYQIMQGYYNKPVETAAAIDEHGWMHTGDTALFRPDGHIKFIGRFKDMLKVGGENVSPAEVESYIMELTNVDQIAVVGYPDARLTEVPVAFIVPKTGLTVSLKQVNAHCKGKIASYKIPKFVINLDILPMTPTGKIQKHKLRTLALEEIPKNSIRVGSNGLRG